MSHPWLCRVVAHVGSSCLAHCQRLGHVCLLTAACTPWRRATTEQAVLSNSSLTSTLMHLHCASIHYLVTAKAPRARRHGLTALASSERSRSRCCPPEAHLLRIRDGCCHPLQVCLAPRKLPLHSTPCKRLDGATSEDDARKHVPAEGPVHSSRWGPSAVGALALEFAATGENKGLTQKKASPSASPSPVPYTIDNCLSCMGVGVSPVLPAAFVTSLSAGVECSPLLNPRERSHIARDQMRRKCRELCTSGCDAERLL
jgi:hypothetical protein